MISHIAAFNLGRYYNELARQGARAHLAYVKKHVRSSEGKEGIEVNVTLEGTLNDWGTCWDVGTVGTEVEADILIAECQEFVRLMDTADYLSTPNPYYVSYWK